LEGLTGGKHIPGGIQASIGCISQHKYRKAFPDESFQCSRFKRRLDRQKHESTEFTQQLQKSRGSVTPCAPRLPTEPNNQSNCRRLPTLGENVMLPAYHGAAQGVTCPTTSGLRDRLSVRAGVGVFGGARLKPELHAVV